MVSHDPNETCFAEDMLGKIMPALMRMGDIRVSSILELADQCEAEARTCPYDEDRGKLAQMATLLRSWVIDASSPPPPASLTEQRRKTLRIVTHD